MDQRGIPPVWGGMPLFYLKSAGPSEQKRQDSHGPADFDEVIRLRDGFVAQPLVWSGMDPLETADKASDLCREKRVSRTCIDAIGVGAALPAEMMRKEKVVRTRCEDLRSGHLRDGTRKI